MSTNPTPEQTEAWSTYQQARANAGLPAEATEQPIKPKKITTKRVAIVAGLALSAAFLGACGASNTGAPVTGSNNSAASTNSSVATSNPLADWYQATGQTDMTTIATDATAIGNDGTNGNYGNYATDCGTLQTDVSTAQSNPIIPDSTLNNYWQTGLNDLSHGAAACINGDFATSIADTNASAVQFKAITAALG